MKKLRPFAAGNSHRGGIMLRCAFLAALILSSFTCQAFSQSLLQNGKFSKPLAPWKIFSIEGTGGTEKSADGGVLTVKALEVSGKASDRQLIQTVHLEGFTDYVLEFEARADLDVAGELMVVLTEPQAPYGNFGLKTGFRLLPEWEKYSAPFRTIQISPGTELLVKFLMGKMQGTIFFRNVMLVQVPTDT